MENAGRTPDWLTARRAGLVGCRSCGVVHAAGTALCRRCGSALASRDDRSLQRVWAWLIAGMVAYVPANVYPMLLTTTLGRTQENTIVGGALDLAHHGKAGNRRYCNPKPQVSPPRRAPFGSVFARSNIDWMKTGSIEQLQDAPPDVVAGRDDPFGVGRFNGAVTSPLYSPQ